MRVLQYLQSGVATPFLVIQAPPALARTAARDVLYPLLNCACNLFRGVMTPVSINELDGGVSNGVPTFDHRITREESVRGELPSRARISLVYGSRLQEDFEKPIVLFLGK